MFERFQLGYLTVILWPQSYDSNRYCLAVKYHFTAPSSEALRGEYVSYPSRSLAQRDACSTLRDYADSQRLEDESAEAQIMYESLIGLVRVQDLPSSLIIEVIS